MEDEDHQVLAYKFLVIAESEPIHVVLAALTLALGTAIIQTACGKKHAFDALAITRRNVKEMISKADSNDFNSNGFLQ